MKVMSREETVTKYSVQLCVVKVEVTKESIEDGYIEYDGGELEDIEILELFDDYDEALDLYNKHIKN
jgi:hypothetical protein